MSNYGIIIGFGLLIVVAVGSLVLFRRRSLGTRNRIALSILAVGLLVMHQVREGQFDSNAVGLSVAVAIILAAGIYRLWRSEKTPPEQD